MPRFFVPGLPLHVIQRGNDRAPIFRGPADVAFYKRCIGHASQRYGVMIHAYVFMTNHVHLLATPFSPVSVPNMMQSLGRVYVQYFNRTYERTGTLWEGRYKAAIVDDETYLLACMRYIELNPVRACIVASPYDYRWSSFRANGCADADDLVHPHEIYRRLGSSPTERHAAYRELFRDAIPDATIARIRDATQNGWALGEAGFRQMLTTLGRRAERLPKGRGRAAVSAAPNIDSDPLSY